MNYDEVVQELIQVGRRMDSLGYVPATDGNFSVRLPSGEIVATVSGVKKGFLTRRDFVTIDAEGRTLRGSGRVSSEIQMHLGIYGQRPDVGAVVHAHPPTATGFAVAGIPLHQCVLPEVVATIGAIPIAPYGTPSTRQLPDSIAPFVSKYDAVLLANHGAVVFAPDLFQAANRMETVEQFARILYVARTLGHVNLLTPGQVDQLNEIRHRYGFEGRAAECEACRDSRPFTDVDLLLARVGTGTPPAMPAEDFAPDRPESASAEAGCDSAAGSASLAPGIVDDLVDRVAREVARILQIKKQ